MASKELTASGFVSVSKDITGGFTLASSSCSPSHPRVRQRRVGPRAESSLPRGCWRLRPSTDACEKIHLHVESRGFPGGCLPLSARELYSVQMNYLRERKYLTMLRGAALKGGGLQGLEKKEEKI